MPPHPDDRAARTPAAAPWASSLFFSFEWYGRKKKHQPNLPFCFSPSLPRAKDQHGRGAPPAQDTQLFVLAVVAGLVPVLRSPVGFDASRLDPSGCGLLGWWGLGDSHRCPDHICLCAGCGGHDLFFAVGINEQRKITPRPASSPSSTPGPPPRHQVAPRTSA